MDVINQGFQLGMPQTIFYLSNVHILPGMAAQVRIAPRGWMEQRRCGELTTGQYKQTGCGCKQNSMHFPVTLDAELLADDMAVVLRGIDPDTYPFGLYEAQIVLLYRGSEMPVKPLVLIENPEECY